jgi:hypothetical protein
MLEKQKGNIYKIVNEKENEVISIPKNKNGTIIIKNYPVKISTK